MRIGKLGAEVSGCFGLGVCFEVRKPMQDAIAEDSASGSALVALER